MATENWDSTYEATPSNTDKRHLGDDEFRDMKKNIRESLQQGGHYDPSATVVPSTTENDRGRHVVDAGGAGVGPDIYESDGTTKLVEYTDTSIEHNQQTILDKTNFQATSTYTFGTTAVAGGGTNTALMNETYTTAKNPRPVLITWHLHAYMTAAAATSTGIFTVQVERDPSGAPGVWTDLTESGSLVAGITIPLGSDGMTWGGSYIDTGATAHAAATAITYRVRITNPHGTNALNIQNCNFGVFELPASN